MQNGIIHRILRLRYQSNSHRAAPDSSGKASPKSHIKSGDDFMKNQSQLTTKENPYHWYYQNLAIAVVRRAMMDLRLAVLEEKKIKEDDSIGWLAKEKRYSACKEKKRKLYRFFHDKGTLMGYFDLNPDTLIKQAEDLSIPLRMQGNIMPEEAMEEAVYEV